MWLKKWKYRLILMMIIIVQLCYTLYVFADKHQGIHSDEIWSYGLANSYDRPFLDLEDGIWSEDGSITPQIYQNCNQWVDGKIFHDYITVQPGERFAYGSVYHNQTLDVHPPMYYFLVHTVCSLFPDQFSYYYAFFLNAVALVGTQVYLYLLTSRLSGSKAAALLACVLYGGGIGALSTFLFLRQYAMLTMLVVAYTYYSVRVFDEKRYLGYLAGAVIVSFLIFSTQYTGIAYVGVLTALLCAYMLLRGKVRKMFCYGFSIAASLGAFFLFFPAAVRHIFAPRFQVQKCFRDLTQIRMLLNYWSVSSMGYETPIWGTIFWNIFPIVVLALLVVLGMVVFLCRKEVWLPQAVAYAKHMPARFFAFLKQADYAAVIVLVSALAMFAVVSKIIDVYILGTWVIRYIFFVFPLLSCLAVTFGSDCLRLLPGVKRYKEPVLAVIIAVILVRVHMTAPCYFLFEHYGDYQDVPELVKGKNVVMIAPKEVANHWLLACYSPYIGTAKKVFCTSADVLDEHIGQIGDLGEKIDYVFVMLGSFELKPEEEKKILRWYFGDYEESEGADGFEAKPSDSMIILDGEEQVQEEAPEEVQEEETPPLHVAERIRGLNGGCDFDILFGIYVQGTPVCVLELTETP